MQHVVLDRWSRGSSFLHRRDPRAKIIALLAILIALGTARHGLPLLTGGFFSLLIAGLLWARISVGSALARAAVVLPVSGLFAGVSWLDGDPARGASIVLKSYLSALAVVLAISTTPPTVLLGGMGRMGAPHFLLEVGQVLYRYLFVIPEEAQHMSRAAAARGASAWRWAGQGQRFRAAAGALAVLFARSYRRAEHVHYAMLARGFEKTLPVLEANRFGRADVIFTAAAIAAIVALRLAAEGVVG